jgi:hypothetical protein
MVSELRITPGRGGNRHPLSVRTFILDHLAAVREDYGANIHRAYKRELNRLAENNRIVSGKRGIKVKYYHKPSYDSFNKKMNLFAREGLIEFTGREEESDHPMFDNMEWRPIRRYYRLKER